MKIKKVSLSNFRCFASGTQHTQTEIDLDKGITAAIGNNGSGKTALLLALQRLFGETRDERSVKPEDFFVPPGGSIEDLDTSELYIEAWITFPEIDLGAVVENLFNDAAHYTVPGFFNEMSVNGVDGDPTVRIRLEAKWEASGTLDGSIEEAIYWITTPDAVPFGPPEGTGTKHKMSAAQRGQIVLRYIPAARDLNTLAKLAVRQLGRDLVQSITWSDEQSIKNKAAEISEKFKTEPAITKANAAINSCWQALNAADTETMAELTVLPPDIQQIIRSTSVSFSPSAQGQSIGLENLSDGQRSLFHFALVKAILDLKLDLEQEVQGTGENEDVPPFAQSYMRAPALTIFAFEEPENHLSPFFLSKLMIELQKITKGERAQAVLTSHSPSIVSRIEPEAIRYLRRDFTTGISAITPIQLPDDATEAGKFIREAIKAHPEIYFARFAVFGEGASEEIVLPRIAEALEVPMDRSFVAIVPVGGRHMTHFWRLAEQLGIPYATLMDLDLGRSSGDYRQIKAAASVLLAARNGFNESDQAHLTQASNIDRPEKWDATFPDQQAGQLTNQQRIMRWSEWLEKFNIYFAAPLDLDLLMLDAFPDAYKTLEGGQRGPNSPDDLIRQNAAAGTVLGEEGYGPKAYQSHVLFPWYNYLFLGERGKPATHFAALGRITDEEIRNHCPPVLKRLIEKIGETLEGRVTPE